MNFNNLPTRNIDNWAICKACNKEIQDIPSRIQKHLDTYAVNVQNKEQSLGNKLLQQPYTSKTVLYICYLTLILMLFIIFFKIHPSIIGFHYSPNRWHILSPYSRIKHFHSISVVVFFQTKMIQLISAYICQENKNAPYITKEPLPKYAEITNETSTPIL